MLSRGMPGLALLLGALGVGCGGDGGGGADSLNEAVQSQARLEAFGSCSALEDYLEDSAVRDMRASIEQSKEYVRRGGYFGVPAMEDGAAPPAAPTTGGGGPQDYTTTNTQVEGVDEPDFMKNDGTRILTLSGNRLQLARSWPADALQTVGSLALEGAPREMFFEPERHRVTVLSSVYLPQEGGAGGQGTLRACAMFDCYWSDNTTKLTVVDVSTLSAPRVVDELYLPGHYQTARRVDGRLRVVLSEPFHWPDTVRFYPEYRDGERDREELLAAFDQLAKDNERAIRAQPLSRWVREGWRTRRDGSRQDFELACGDFHRSNAATRPGVMTVATVDLDAEGSVPGRTSLVAEPGVVYASADALYVASAHAWWWPEAGQQDHTYVHKFSLKDPARAPYVGSGGVDGYPKDQFSLDEFEGVLRIATTVSRRTEGTDQSPWGTVTTVNRVWTLSQQDGRLQRRGQSEALAEGERIFSARFMGKRGYVVTFRQTDPLYTFDLSDPENPRKVGELKVTGFSTYLHPLGDNHLLALGEERSADGSWQGRALKLTLFDVTDPAAPREAFTQTVGTSSGYSEALWSHKAFNFFPARNLLAIPFADWVPNGADYWGTFVSDLRLFHVSVEGGIVPRGSLALSDLYRTYGSPQWSYTYSPWVRRSVMADDFVYAISDAGIRVARQDAPAQPLATAPFFLAQP
jgi:Beta propeller domain